MEQTINTESVSLSANYSSNPIKSLHQKNIPFRNFFTGIVFLMLGLFIGVTLYIIFSPKLNPIEVAEVGVAGSVGFNNSATCVPLSGNTYQCSPSQIGTRCENGSGTFNGQCIFWKCPYGDTNNDCGCGVGDAGVTSEIISCESAKTKAVETGDTCYQFDSLDSGNNWCIIDQTCKSVQDNFRTCTIQSSSPSPSPTLSPSPTPSPLSNISCTGLTSTPAISPAPAIGDKLTFTCAGVVTPSTAGVLSYKFRYSINSGAVTALANKTTTTAELSIAACGTYKVECQACATLNGVLTCDPIWTGATQ